LPVVVAARLSLSFPLLFGAIPLWAIDDEREGAPVARCRFSDGGICSNFPIHLFDGAVPEWPTFGIHLIAKTPWRYTVWLPQRHDQGRHDAWYRFDDGDSELSLGGFLSAIAYSAKDWNDKTAMRMPGVRDRVVQIALDSGGSLNLKLTPRDMQKLARWGRRAGRTLVRRFIDEASNAPGRGGGEHRWVRFHTFLTGLRERIELIRDATERRVYGQPLAEQIEDATLGAPLDGEVPIPPPQADDLKTLLALLHELEATFARASLPQPYKPVPKPSLHIRAPL